MPLWVNEGLSDYMTGSWRPQDLMAVRDAALTDIIPKMSKLEGASELNARMVYNLGHAVFEFIEAKWGKEGLRQYLFNLRKAAVSGGEEAYQESFQISADDFDQQFDKYLKDCSSRSATGSARPITDETWPPIPSARTSGTSIPSSRRRPASCWRLRRATGADREMDIILVSAKDGKRVPDGSLTHGFDQDLRLRYLVTPGDRWVTVPWMSWSSIGDLLAYFARAEKSKNAHRPERPDPEGRGANRPADGGRSGIARLLS